MKSFKQFITEMAADVKDNENFWDWFENSVMVDDAGNPMVLYHGTSANFTEFSHDDIPYRGGLLAFFSEHEFANNYSKSGPRIMTGGNLMPVFLKIEKPFDFRDRSCVWDAEYWFEDNRDSLDEYDMSRIVGDFNGVGMEEITEEMTEAFTKKEFAKLVSQGSWTAIELADFMYDMHKYHHYDGVIMKEMDALTYGVFEPNQVKSATGNNGNYDPNDDDITK